MAVYNSSGLAYYRHSDWLGSSRFASTPSRTVYFDGAYAPFGGPGFKGAVGVLQDAGLTRLVGQSSAETVGNVIGVAKLIYDLGHYGYGFVKVCK